MNRDIVYREITRLLRTYQSMTHHQLSEAVRRATREIVVGEGKQAITAHVEVMQLSPTSFRIEASAFGDNWWKTERMDESVTIEKNIDD
jgi:hypothetical protein